MVLVSGQAQLPQLRRRQQSLLGSSSNKKLGTFLLILGTVFLLILKHFLYDSGENQTLRGGHVMLKQNVQVMLYPYLVTLDKNPGTTLLPTFLEAMEESKFLYLADNMMAQPKKRSKEGFVWVGLVDAAANNMKRRNWCNRFHQHVLHVQEETSTKKVIHKWPIYIVDNIENDNPEIEKIRCKGVEKLVGIHNVHYYSKQSVSVHGRHWNDTLGWVDLGKLVVPYDKHGGDNIRDEVTVLYQPIPFTVQTEIVQTLQESLQTRYQKSLGDAIESMPRILDITIYPETKKIVGASNGKLRITVVDIIKDIGLKQEGVKTYIGNSNGKGDSDAITKDRVGLLLDSKIILVVKEDTSSEESWSLLFEAMLGGAMVMTDQILPGLPAARILTSGTHFVEFDGPQDLRDKILYYLEHPTERLEIARRGRELVMTNQRSWHGVEEIVFGRPGTDCSVPGASLQCPYAVHA